MVSFALVFKAKEADSSRFGRTVFQRIKSYRKVTNFDRFVHKACTLILFFTEVNSD